jgi:hypothetical protein
MVQWVNRLLASQGAAVHVLGMNPLLQWNQALVLVMSRNKIMKFFIHTYVFTYICIYIHMYLHTVNAIGFNVKSVTMHCYTVNF